MQLIYKILSLTFAAIYICHTEVHATCNACMTNDVACVNETSFQMCFDGKRDTRQTFPCPEGKVCTKLAPICFDEDSFEPACQLNVVCGNCTGNKPFVCISRTQFAQCNGAIRTENIGTCPTGKVCNTNKGICVDKCDEPECDRETPA